jgi:hypothetical protein
MAAKMMALTAASAARPKPKQVPQAAVCRDTCSSFSCAQTVEPSVAIEETFDVQQITDPYDVTKPNDYEEICRHRHTGAAAKKAAMNASAHFS